MRYRSLGVLTVWTLALTVTALDVVRDGKACAIVVTPDSPSSPVAMAARELVAHIEKASKTRLEIVPESRAAGRKEARIYLGKCAANRDLSLVDRKHNSFICDVRPDSLRLVGRDQEGGGVSESKEFGTLLGVYYLLDRDLGVRWLWPGELGCFVPRKRSVAIADGRIEFTPPLQSSRYSLNFRGPYGWRSPQAHRKFKSDEELWERRHGLAWDLTLHCAGHAMFNYYNVSNEATIQAHPGWFNLLPDGTRRSDPCYFNGRASLISMCVSNPELHRYLIGQWRKLRKPGRVGWNVPATENDTPGKCLCPACLAWDDPSLPADRVEKAKKAFAAGQSGWAQNLDLATRYCRFYLALEKLAKEVDPKAKVLGFAYANYTNPPRNVKLNPDIQIGYVGNLTYPWTAEKMDTVKRGFAGWAATGCTMKFRPNFMLDGHNMPIFFARRLHDLYHFALQHGLNNVYYDSNIGQYAVNGPTMYTLVRMILHPELSADAILEEYYAAFAPADREIKEYFEHWEKISQSQATLDAFNQSNFESVGAANGDFNHFYALAPSIYTPEVMAKGFTILAKAKAKAAGDPEASARIDYLRKGLRNSELTLNAQRSYISGDAARLDAAVAELDAFRASVEAENIGNMNFLATREDLRWNRPFLEMKRRFAGNLLPGPWRFAFDAENAGVSGRFFASDFDDSTWDKIEVGKAWEETAPGRAWKAKHGKNFDGFGWYRVNFTVPKIPSDSKVLLHFSSVDEACKVYVNGEQLLDRPYPYKGDRNSWRMPFQIDITDRVKPGRNQLTVRVEDKSGMGGITGLVALQVVEGGNAENLLDNGGFEFPRGAWTTRSNGSRAARFDYDTQRPLAGVRCALIASQGEGDYPWQSFQQKVRVEKGRRYRLHGHFRTSPDMTGLIVIGCGGALNKHIAFRTNTKGNWQEFLLDDLSAAADGETTIFLRTGRNFRGKLWFDEVSLSDTAPQVVHWGENLVPNGDFEIPRQKWIRRGPDRTIAYDANVKKSGKYSCRLKAVSQGQNGIYQQNIPVKAGKTYRFRCQVRPGSDFSGRLLVQILGALKQHRVIQDVKDEWVEVVFRNLKAEKDGTVGIYVNTLPEGRGTFWVDAVELTERQD